MNNQVLYFILAGIMLLLLPLAPKLLIIRIRILRWLRLRALANWHERHAAMLITIARFVIVALAILLVLLAVGWIA